MGIDSVKAEIAEMEANMDDLDHADTLLEAARNSVDYEQGTAYATLAAAHIQLWWAKETRAYRDASNTHRRIMQSAQPPAPPLPFPPMQYNGF
jgi:hypothetical protein